MGAVDLRAYPGFNADPYPHYAALRELGPVHEVFSVPGEPFWLIVGHEESRAALTDPRLSKSAASVGAEMFGVDVIGPHLLVVDPPDHTRLRRLVAREFTMRRVEQLAPRVQEITDELLDVMLPAGHGDLVDALAFPLPIIVICELLGIPSGDRDAFRAWSNEVVTPTGFEESRAAIQALAVYLDELIEDKRCQGPSGDLLSALIRTRAEDDDRLSAAELRALTFLLLIAGHETTVNLISNGVRALLAHPGQLADLRADFSLLDGAVEEMLRYDGPVETATVRYTTEPVPVGDVVIPAGVIVLVGLAAADRDPARYPSPDTFDIRRDTRGHLAFGHGIHFCLGAPLARLEARIALRSLLTRCPDLAPDPSAGPLDWLPGMLIRGVRRLPLRW
ncbi:cytochrome P450 [Streptomyces sp. NPDC004609]|uniref:cytochrome P450 family protein n=1 Tax=Streptomyces sp. NPDC004609 TaxID=3364704 RepID=UPI0036C0920C